MTSGVQCGMTSTFSLFPKRKKLSKYNDWVLMVCVMINLKELIDGTPAVRPSDSHPIGTYVLRTGSSFFLVRVESVVQHIYSSACQLSGQRRTRHISRLTFSKHTIPITYHTIFCVNHLRSYRTLALLIIRPRAR